MWKVINRKDADLPFLSVPYIDVRDGYPVYLVHPTREQFKSKERSAATATSRHFSSGGKDVNMNVIYCVSLVANH